MERYVRLILAVIVLIIGFIPTAYAGGFQFPMVPKYCEASTSTCGYHYAQYADYNSGWVYHPGWDMNSWGTSGDNDCGDPIYAVADGTVEVVNTSTWGGLLLSHEYNGETFYSMYGHVQSVHVTDGQTVDKGDHIADIGKVGTSACHLHLEIRTDDHPDIFTSNYWNTTDFRDLSLLNEWYEDPEDFLRTHARDWRYDTALTVTNSYSSSSNYLGTQSGDMHWWDGYAVDDPTDNGAVSNGYAQTIYIQDYNGAYCDSSVTYNTGVNDGAIVYDALGGARSAYIVQCEQWQAWVTEDAPYVGPESWLGNPVTNVYKAGYYNYYQLFQHGYIRVNANGTVTTKTYANGFAPGEMEDGSWNPQLSYRFAEAYELRGAHEKLGMPLSGVEQLSSNYYVQHFPGQKPRSDDDRYLLYGVEQQEIVKISPTQYSALVSSGSTSVSGDVDDTSTDTLDQDADNYTPDQGDCDDTDATIHPDHPEWNDGLDNDCDDEVDNLFDQSTWDYTSQVLTNLASVDLADLASSVSCSVDEPDSLYVVLNGQDGRIYEFETIDDGQTWTSSHLTSLAAVPLSAPGTTPHLFIDPDTGDRYVTFVGDNARINLFHYNGSTWSAVELTSVVAAPLADSTSSPFGYIANGVIYVVFQGNDQRIWWFTITNGTTYGSLDLTGQAAVEYAMPGTSPMAVYNDLTGEHHIVFQGINQRIQRLTFNGSTWSSVQITSVVNSDLLDPDSSPMTYVDPFTSYVYTVINGENERIDLIADYHNNSWGSDELTSIIAVPLTEPSTSPTGYIDPFTGHHVITLQGDNGRINQFEGPPWTSIDQTSQAAVEFAAPGTSPATCVDSFTGVRHTVFVGDNGRVQYLRYGP